jgi:molecular chaperone DnaK (HSP70)
MGHTQSTAVVVKIGSFESNDAPLATKLSHATNDNLGALHFDLKLFEHFSSICAAKHGGAVIPGSKRGQRLILGCERIRKLLSQLPESSITVENMSDSGDVNFSLKRNDLTSMCADILEAFKTLIKKTLTSAGIQLGKTLKSEKVRINLHITSMRHYSGCTHTSPLHYSTATALIIASQLNTLPHQNRVILAVKIFVYVYFPRSIMRIIAET